MQSGWVTKCPARDGLARLTRIPVRLGHAEWEARDRVDPEDFVTRPSTPAEKEMLEEAGVPNADSRVLHILYPVSEEERDADAYLGGDGGGEGAARCT